MSGLGFATLLHPKFCYWAKLPQWRTRAFTADSHLWISDTSQLLLSISFYLNLLNGKL